MIKLELPDRSLVPTLGDYDLDFLTRLIYHPVSGVVYRHRLQMVLDGLAETGPCEKVLEVGFGPGLLLPSLSRVCEDVEGVDLHEEFAPVRGMLDRLGLSQVRLRHGSVLELPYDDGAFSHVVCMSVLEHIRAIDVACAELARVTRVGGWVVLGFPVKNAITRGLFRVLGYNDDHIHPSSHRDIMDAAARQLRPRGELRFPFSLPADLSLYMATWLQRV